MDISKLVRDASKVRPCLMINGKGQLIAARDCKFYSPVRYSERGLTRITGETRIVSIYGIVVEDRYYAVANALALIQITPTSTNIVKVEEDEYYEFSFEKGSMISPNTDLVKDDQIAYKVYDEFIAKGNIPWYFNYEDIGKLFITAKQHAGIHLADNNIPLEMIATVICRQATDRKLYYRHQLRSMDDQMRVKPAYVPFRSVIYNATSTVSKLMGAYFDDGLMSALVNPGDKVEGVEALLRK